MARKPKIVPVEKLDVKRQRLSLDVRCGDCMFFKKAGIYKDAANVDRSCEGFGTVTGSDPCRWFTADSKYFNGQLGDLLQILNKVERPQVLAAVLLSAKRMKRFGLALGQKVYFHVMGGDYICNYASGLVIGSVKGVIVIESDGYVARLKAENILDEEAWKIKLSSLLKKDKINDPNGGLRKIKTSNQSRLQVYEPHTVTSVKKPQSKKPKTRIINLTGSRR